MDDWLDAGTNAVLAALESYNVPARGDPTGANRWRPSGQDPTGMRGWSASGPDPTGMGGYRISGQDPTGMSGYRLSGQDPTGMGGYRLSGMDPTGMGAYRLSGQDPTGLGGWTPGANPVNLFGPDRMSSVIDQTMAYAQNESILVQQKVAAEQAAQLQAGMQQGQSGTSTPSGTMGNPTGPTAYYGQWEEVNKWNNEIASAIGQVAQETGVAVDGNRIKAHMMIESLGDPCNENTGGAMGLMQVTPQSWGAEAVDWSRMGCSGGAAADPYYQIYSGVRELALRYQNAPPDSYAHDGDRWAATSRSYFSGDYYPGGSAVDGVTTTTEAHYAAMMASHMAQLLAAGQQTYGGTNVPPGQGPGGASGAAPMPGDWMSYGVSQSNCEATAFAQGEGCARYYGYAESVGCPACTHPGMDISMPEGTQLVSPVSGVVQDAGCTGFYDYNGDGETCGRGQLTIIGDDGNMYILGHTQQIYPGVGQRVNAGDLVAISGTENGDHLHYEVRGPDGMVIDPMGSLGGGVTPTGVTPSGGTTGGPTPTGYTPPTYGYPTGNTNIDIANYWQGLG